MLVVFCCLFTAYHCFSFTFRPVSLTSNDRSLALHRYSNHGARIDYTIVDRSLWAKVRRTRSVLQPFFVEEPFSSSMSSLSHPALSVGSRQEPRRVPRCRCTHHPGRWTWTRLQPKPGAPPRRRAGVGSRLRLTAQASLMGTQPTTSYK